jgi:hypothetical protein
MERWQCGGVSRIDAEYAYVDELFGAAVGTGVKNSIPQCR